MLNKRTSLQIMRDTIHALMMREIKTRFGSNRLGYFWAVAEPAIGVAIMGIMFTLIGRTAVYNIPITLFLFTGILPFTLYKNLFNQLAAAIDSNKGLLSYRQVTAIDPVMTRIIIEVATYFVVYILIFSVMAWLGFNALPVNPLGLLAASLLLTVFTIGIGLILCSAMTYWKDTKKLLGFVNRPMFFISGIFFCAPMIPPQYWYLFDWNPVFHVTELSRDSFFKVYVTPVGSWGYLSACALVSFSIGLSTFYLCRFRFIRS
ncbi:ABC transporter permease [Shewanella gaetbuli]|uniref:Transport permease protein n=1 Tax=Shewanella gaetbuli TaxID=220752 RepID=A0A9X2CHS1_9GAMM|nr:ABC transporter permease [Shewanella gaetbuli]MCL1142322.1 ABC transporter permease [Shewanella gaetbuli]